MHTSLTSWTSFTYQETSIVSHSLESGLWLGDGENQLDGLSPKYSAWEYGVIRDIKIYILFSITEMF